jgi:hypothetical protein
MHPLLKCEKRNCLTNDPRLSECASTMDTFLHYTGKVEEKAFEHNFKISYQHKRTCLNFNLVKVFYLASSILFLLNFNLILI